MDKLNLLYNALTSLGFEEEAFEIKKLSSDKDIHFIRDTYILFDMIGLPNTTKLKSLEKPARLLQSPTYENLFYAGCSIISLIPPHQEFAFLNKSTDIPFC